MLRSEFELLTDIYPSETLYSVIERFYMDSKEDKHDFCYNYKFNVDGLAQRIQTEANKLESAKENLSRSKIFMLQAQLELAHDMMDFLYEIYEGDENN